MEPFDNQELRDDELDSLLSGWITPAAPAQMRERIFTGTSAPWWRRIWTASIRIPVPLAVCLAAAAGLGVWRYTATLQPHVVVKTERVEVPIMTERVVTRLIYRDRPAPVLRAVTVSKLQPVTELRPRIIRSQDANN